MRKLGLLALALLALGTPAHGQVLPAYPNIPASQVQATDFVELNSTRFVYNTFISMPQLAAYVGLQQPAATAAGQIPYYANSGSSRLTPITGSPFAAGSVILGAGPAGLSNIGPFAAGLPILGNGASGLTTGTISGNSTALASVDATPVNGDCAQFDSAGGLVPVTCPGGGGGGGTVSSGLAGEPAFYPANGTTVVGLGTGSKGQIFVSAGPGAFPSPVTPSCIWAGSLGFVGDGSTSNTTAWNNFVNNYADVGSTCLEFGPGTYVFPAASNLDINMPNAAASLTIKGAGASNTLFSFPSTSLVNSIQINIGNKFLNSFHLRDFTMQTASINTGTGIAIFGAGEADYPDTSDITNVTVRGADLFTSPGTSTECFSIAIELSTVDHVSLDNVNTYGSWGAPGSAGCGVGLTYGGGGGQYATVLNVVNSSFNLHDVGVELGNYWQGFTCILCNFNGEEGAGCIIEVGGAAGTLSLLNVTASQLNCNGAQIELSSSVDNVMLSGNVLSPYGVNSIGFQGIAIESAFTGNVFNVGSGGSSQNGLSLSSGSSGVTITGNTFESLSGGVLLQSGSSGVTLSNNSYINVSTHVVNNGGVACPASASGNCIGTATP